MRPADVGAPLLSGNRSLSREGVEGDRRHRGKVLDRLRGAVRTRSDPAPSSTSSTHWAGPSNDARPSSIVDLRFAIPGTEQAGPIRSGPTRTRVPASGPSHGRDDRNGSHQVARFLESHGAMVGPAPEQRAGSPQYPRVLAARFRRLAGSATRQALIASDWSPCSGDARLRWTRKDA